jgi:Tfp pilus assembly protein PilO
MINLRDRNEVWPTVVSITSVIVLAGTFGYMIYVTKFPLPSTDVLDRKANEQKLAIKENIKKADARKAESQALIDKVTWSSAPEDIQTNALKIVSEAAATKRLKLSAFHPQRPAVADNLDTLPFQVTVEGPFLDVLDFERMLEIPKTRLAVSLIQISSADPSTDRITANIGVVAYMKPKASNKLSDTSKGGTTHA